MRKVLFLLSAVSIVVLSCSKSEEGGSQITGFQREGVLVELFTNVYCANCPEAEHFIDSVALADPRVIPIAYHMPLGNFPDSMYMESKPHCDARWGYYEGGNVEALPVLYFCGVLRNEGIENIDGWMGQIENLLSEEMPCSLAISCTFDPDLRSGQVKVEVIGEISGNLYVRVALTESNVKHRYMGRDTLYHHVLRTMCPDAQGVKVTSNDEITVNFSIPEDWKMEDMHCVVFLQDDDTKTVLQAKSLKLVSP